MKTYFGYIRVSTVRQGEKGVSLPEQKEAIERYAIKNNLTISSWFEEQQTAAKRGRPIWTKMLKLLRTGKVAGVMIHKMDRSARNLKDWADLGELIDQGIEVHFANESLDLASRGGRLSADIQAVVAADYIRNLREEAKKGIYGRLKQGFYPFRAPIGYRDNGQGKPKTICPERGPMIKLAFDLYRTTKFDIPNLKDELYRRGLRNLNGGPVSVNGLSTILRNPFYVGVIRIRTTNQYFPGNHEPLISKRIFEEVQDILDGRLTARPEKHEFLFRRIVKCKTCRHSLIGERQKGYVYYRCHTKTCPTTSVREEAIDTVIRENLRKLSFSEAEKSLLADMIANLKHHWIEDRERQLAQANIRAQGISERLNRLTDAYLDQAIDKALFEERKAALLFQRQEAEEALRTLKDPNTSIPDTLEKFLELADGASSLYQMAIPLKMREIVKITSSNVSVDQKTVDFTWQIPFREIAAREINDDGRPSQGLVRTWTAMLAWLPSQIPEGLTALLGDERMAVSD